MSVIRRDVAINSGKKNTKPSAHKENTEQETEDKITQELARPSNSLVPDPGVEA